MAVTDISILQEQLPNVFKQTDPPLGWDDFVVVPAEFDPEDPLTTDHIEEVLLDEDVQHATDTLNRPSEGRAPDIGRNPVEVAIPQTAEKFPGSPRRGGAPFPPPDALGFYLPFHFYYHNNLWGVYLIAEGVDTLAAILQHVSGSGGKELSKKNAVIAARLFIYYHEAFHHNVEAFATRLEVTHRLPLYKHGFLSLYKEQLKAKASTEEGLATGYALRKVYKAFNGQVLSRVREGLTAYVEALPPSYQSGLKLVEGETFRARRGEFAEDNHGRALPHADKAPELWRLFGQGFRGIAQINSFTNYLVSRHSSLFRRTSFDARPLSMSKVKKRLKDLVGLERKRQGKGSHELWMTEGGRTVTLYNRSGDVPKGTLSSILKQAGLSMSVHDFLRG